MIEMKLIDILTSLEDNDFVEIMEVNTTDELHCYVKDSIKYLEKFKKVLSYDMTVTNYQFIKELNIHRVWVNKNYTYIITKED
jgi:pyrroloquinoline quinone (PQQ) biosynthesis protein C